MQALNEQLQQAMQRLADAKSATTRLQGVRQDIRIKQHQLEGLAELLEKEQEDVRRLSGKSITALLAALWGDRTQKLEKERAEAAAALLKHHQCEEELLALQKQEHELLLAASSLKGAQRQLAAIWQQKLDMMLTKDDHIAALLKQEIEKQQKLAVQEKELSEAALAGRRALTQIEDLLDHLSSAKKFSTWDMVGGGSLASWIKHSHLDEAQATAGRVQQHLNRFNSELRDVQILYRDQISVAGFARFADFFFDGLLVDWSIHSHINLVTEQAKDLRKRVADIVDKKLQPQLQSCQQQLKQAQEKIDRLMQQQ